MTLPDGADNVVAAAQVERRDRIELLGAAGDRRRARGLQAVQPGHRQAQLEEQRRQREMAQNSSPETAGNSGAGVAATTASTESSSSARTPASSDQSPLGRLLEAANGLPVPPQYIAAGLLVFAFCALLLRRRPE